MHEKALRDAVRDMDWNNIFRYLSFIIQVLVMPVAVTSCSLSLYAVVRSVLSRRRRKKKEKMAQKYNLRRNYEMNKRMAKKMRREAP
jgi:ABC-type protease/lipase transport system fused ATPase/permease subunit